MSIRRSPDLRRRAGLIVRLAASMLTCAAAAQDLDPIAERQRIDRERAQVETAAREAEAACARQFVITACVERTRAERRDRLRQLDRQRVILDEAQRKQRAADRRTAIRARQDAAANTPPAVETRAREPRAPQATAPATAAPSPPDRAQAHAKAASDAEQAARRRAYGSAQRAEEAKAHRAQAERRRAENAARHKPAQALAIPAAASLPTR
jgi:membrane protein involved in colicin uptake